MSKQDAEMIYGAARLIADKYLDELISCLVSDLDWPREKAVESVNVLSFLLGYAAGLARMEEGES